LDTIAIVGAIVGTKVGLVVDPAAELSEFDHVGTVVRAIVGKVVREAVGFAVAGVGKIVGEAVGFAVAGVGKAVGEAVGFAVAGVGKIVGEAVG